jgi:hypothetical protein
MKKTRRSIGIQLSIECKLSQPEISPGSFEFRSDCCKIAVVKRTTGIGRLFLHLNMANPWLIIPTFSVTDQGLAQPVLSNVEASPRCTAAAVQWKPCLYLEQAQVNPLIKSLSQACLCGLRSAKSCMWFHI